MENTQIKQELTKKEKNNNIILNYLLKISKINQLLMTVMDFNNNIDIDLILVPETFNKVENMLITIIDVLYKVIDKITGKDTKDNGNN